MATAGYTSIGASSVATGSTTAQNPDGLLVTIPQSASIQKITVYTSNKQSTSSQTCNIYSGSAGSRNSSVLGTTQISSVTTTAQWIDFPFSPNFPASGQTYWLEYVGDGANGPGGDFGNIFYDTGGATNSGYIVNDIGAPQYNTNQFSMYATYTPNATGGFNISFV